MFLAAVHKIRQTHGLSTPKVVTGILLGERAQHMLNFLSKYVLGSKKSKVSLSLTSFDWKITIFEYSKLSLLTFLLQTF